MKLVLLSILLIKSSFASAYDVLCPSVHVHKLKSLKLNDNEKRLLCGDRDEKAYKEIPVYQAKYFMQGFLQSRGHLRPFLRIEKGILLVRPGPVAKVKKVNVKAKDDKLKKDVQTELRHLYKNRVLSTRTLDSIEAEALGQVRKRGYPCAKIESEAEIDSDVVEADVFRLRFHEFGEIKKEPIKGLRANALDRFYPFQSNDPFNADLLKLTEKRMLREEVVQGTYFLEECLSKDFSISQQFIEGPPRTVRYGIGASTELGPMARLRWSHNRYHSLASQITVSAEASFRSQSLNFTADNYFWHEAPRRSVLTQAEVMHEKQVDYEQVMYSVKPQMKFTRDSEGYHKLYLLGPAYEGGTYHSSNNVDTRSYSSGSLRGTVQWMGHDYELFDILPEEGDLYRFDADYYHPTVGFATSLLKLQSMAVNVKRMSNWGRGTLVGAGKFILGTSAVDTNKVSLASLPPSMKFYGGGSDDIRGFYLRTLPENNGQGALTKAVLKLEARRTYLYLQSIEAFGFLDGGYFGEESWSLKSPLYYSPGFGLRWLSPFGLVQGYISRGLTVNPNSDSGNFYYVGIGGTF